MPCGSDRDRSRRGDLCRRRRAGACAGADATEEPPSVLGPSLLRPVARWCIIAPADGSRSRNAPKSEVAPSRIGNLPTFGNPPGASAGTTGFNSTNVPRLKSTIGTGAPATTATALAPAGTTTKTDTKTTKSAKGSQPASSAAATSRREDLTGTITRAPRGSERRRIPAAGDTPEDNASRIAALRRRRAEEDLTAFDPIGVRVGAFVLTTGDRGDGRLRQQPVTQHRWQGLDGAGCRARTQHRSDWLRS